MLKLVYLQVQIKWMDRTVLGTWKSKNFLPHEHQLKRDVMQLPITKNKRSERLFVFYLKI